MGAAAARKPVTILFCDLVGSTALGERLDAERFRDVLGRWHAAMRAPVEQHGGTVEKFIGDALEGVFGVPSVHEDDALRAVQAAVRMREALDQLNAELALEQLPRLEIRIGIQSGEVAVGAAAATLVTGDAVNTAKRLEEAAPPGEILVGEATRVLVANAVLLEPAEAVDAKGKAQPVPAHRVLRIAEDAGSFARRLDAPLIGRVRELAQLEAELDAAIRERSCRVVTVYGDGITFLPLRELLRSAGAYEQADAATTEETMSIVRRLLETRARSRPLVLCVEDVHWAEPTFLDLLEYVAAWSDDAPILLLCLARPELVDRRPRWPGTSIVLRPLSEAEAEALLDALEAEWPLTAELRRRIAEAAEGNPLFVEQMVAMLAGTEGSADVVPPTIQALLAARLDRLEPLERSVLERAAVIGREFSRAPLAELSEPEERQTLPAVLLSLVRNELLRPGRPRAAGIDTFRFAHALVRDAAYAQIPKTARAELHARYAGWLESNEHDDELAGYHLEQAYRSTRELGLPDAAVAERAAVLLGGAGRRAHARQDMPAAANLLERALALDELGPSRGELLRELASARWRLGRTSQAAATLAEAIEHARRAGDVRLEWICRLDGAARRRMLRGGDDDLVAVATEAIRVFSELGDDAGLARAWRRLALASASEWRYADAAMQAERALAHAERAGDHADDVALTDTYCSALLFGPEPAPAAAARCRELLDRYGGERMVRAVIVSSLGGLEAMQGSFDAARALVEEAAAVFDELGLRMTRAGLAEVKAEIERLGGDVAAAERELRLARDVFRAAGSPAVAGLSAAALAGLLVEQERLDEAEELLAEARASLRDEDIDGHVAARLAASRLALARGGGSDAERLADEALATMKSSDAVAMRAQLLAVRAAARGEHPDEAIAAFEAKGNVAAAARLRDVVGARATR